MTTCDGRHAVNELNRLLREEHEAHDKVRSQLAAEKAEHDRTKQLAMRQAITIRRLEEQLEAAEIAP